MLITHLHTYKKGEPMEASTIKAMRDGLNEIRSRLTYLYGHIDGTFDPPALKEVYEIAGTALSAPPRNCDVGTPEDQRNRFMRFCDSKSMGYCWGRGCRKCMAQWGQIQYEGENEEVKK